MVSVHLRSSEARAMADHAPARARDTRAGGYFSADKMAVGTTIVRWDTTDAPVVIDVTVQFDVVASCPAYGGRWQGEPADRSAPIRSEYSFGFTSAYVDDPDETDLTPDETVQLAAWFDENHDALTEDAADDLRGEGL